MNDLQALLAQSAADLFAAEVTPSVLVQADGGAWPEKLWNVLAGAGYPNLFVDDDGDVRWADAFPLVFAAGAALAPVPLPETLAASWLLKLLGIAAPSGIITLVPQRSEEPWRARLVDTRWRVSGRGTAVPWASRADAVVVIVSTAGGKSLALLPAASLMRTVEWSIAGEPRDTILAEDADALDVVSIQSLPEDIVQRFGALIRATQIAGAIDAILKMTVAYAGQREQFGKPIETFQAVSQQIAVMVEEAVAVRVAAAVAWQSAGDDPATNGIGLAKIRAGKAASTVPGIAHAVFGAIGITAEHTLHFATRRLWSWRAEFGSETVWARDAGASIVLGRGRHLWPSITAGRWLA